MFVGGLVFFVLLFFFFLHFLLGSKKSVNKEKPFWKHKIIFTLNT